MKKLRLLAVLIFMASCEESTAPLECLTNIGCTEQFEVFTYAPLDSENQPVVLDSYYSINLDNGNRYDFSDELGGQSLSIYPVISDAQRKEVKKNGTLIRFVGLKDDVVIIEQDFKIGHDCCHILPLEGPGVVN